MGKSTNIQISRVHLTSKLGQTFVAILGVTFGVSMYIFMNSFMNGVNKAQDDLAFRALSHIRIYNEDSKNTYNPIENQIDQLETLVNIHNRKNIQYTTGLQNSSAIVSFITNQNDVVAVARQVNSNVFFRSGSKQVNGIISGVELKSEDALFKTSETIIQGDWNNLSTNKTGIILGKLLAEKLGLKMNNSINVLNADGVSKNYIVVGIFESNLKSMDESKAYLNIISARQLISENSDFASDIVINIKDRNNTATFINKIAPMIPYQVESWQEANEQLVAGSELRNIIAVAVSLTILLVAGFGIYNIMTMTINEKIREIAILKALGFSGNDIKAIFLTQASVIGILGALVGVVIGYGVSILINQIPFTIAGMETLPVFFQVQDFIFAAIFGVLTTLVAGYIPSRRASRIDPVNIIRG
jgi:lipoprotein-releasing system permease protein